MEKKGEGVRILGVKLLRMAAFFAVAAGVVWAEEKIPEEKKGEASGQSAEEKVKVGRGMAFQAFAAEQQGAWGERAGHSLDPSAAGVLPGEAGGHGGGPAGF
ncbi:MAG: hypothetical protein EBT95_04680 [Verrucomicrobia bacterium]|nr:hypothetical protein [Verrucomicrobiota bacterium]